MCRREEVIECRRMIDMVIDSGRLIEEGNGRLDTCCNRVISQNELDKKEH